MTDVRDATVREILEAAGYRDEPCDRSDHGLINKRAIYKGDLLIGYFTAWDVLDELGLNTEASTDGSPDLFEIDGEPVE